MNTPATPQPAPLRAVRALTVAQPWAGAIAHLGKDVENRTWGTRYRGPLLIHASGRPDPVVAQHVAADLARTTLTQVRRAAGPTGCHVAIADLVDVCRTSFDGDWCDCGRWAEPGRFHWRLANIRPLTTPIPARGHLGLWTPNGVMTELPRSLGGGSLGGGEQR